MDSYGHFRPQAGSGNRSRGNRKWAVGVAFSAFHFLPPKFPLAENDVVSARWGTKWRAETFPRRNCPLLNFPHTNRNNPILRAEMVQVPEVALFLRGDFPVWFAPIFQYCSFISSIHPLLRFDEALLPELLIISLSLRPLTIFDKYWTKAAMARRGPNKWNKEDNATLIDLMQKNLTIWDTKFGLHSDRAGTIADLHANCNMTT